MKAHDYLNGDLYILKIWLIYVANSNWNRFDWQSRWFHFWHANYYYEKEARISGSNQLKKKIK